MALAFTSSVPFPAAAARGLLQQQQQQVHVVGGGRVLLLGSAPSPGSGTLVLAVSVPAVGGAKAPAPLRRACAAGDNASPSDKEKAFLEAMEEARGKFHAVISAGDKTVLERRRSLPLWQSRKRKLGRWREVVVVSTEAKPFIV
ncbi:uncharacterized protein [Triticum aestivum]|uniref:uncharacterized protein n=1 Tax=Triticum aestivum TaxID=4565 RepID=UPI001D0327AC|nr:uncharacterized protein LOC123086713 [Triticum aestivum]